ncbi:MAG: twin-arginine translocase TatA/TatE family subunit [Novosphingobium sp.]|uniref:twin-arginine translocase TatA/TatE family subunit n=1 Tax=Tsuneonella sp. CC-YZS046 TaxID=3042152 RepID=UPI002D794501|nr:twin-arginine translocase TatA/TatE family subunit [Tsuneonella sp. CC-YZS046]WRO66912.1 twin-arginine translocase TatA/TatE family subunit [Tsuneonella sp. CC-YZS046]
MNIGPFQLLIIALVILVLFGRGRIAEMMGDFGKGIKNFKQGMSESDTPPAPPAQIDSQPPEPAPEAKSTDGSSQP